MPGAGSSVGGRRPWCLVRWTAPPSALVVPLIPSLDPLGKLNRQVAGMGVLGGHPAGMGVLHDALGVQHARQRHVVPREPVVLKPWGRRGRQRLGHVRCPPPNGHRARPPPWRVMVVGAPQQLEQVGVVGKRQVRHVMGVQLQHRHQRNRVPVRLRLTVDAFPGGQVEAAGARHDPVHLRRLLHGVLKGLTGPPAPVCRVEDGTEALQIRRRDRLASFGRERLAHGPGRIGGPQQGAAQRAVTPAWGAGAGVQADRRSCEPAKLGEDGGDVQRWWWGGPAHLVCPDLLAR
jgi:hypothetical protein